MGDAARKSALYDAFARTGKALSSGKRLELLDLLAQGERPVEALARAAGLNLTTASAHLQTLKQAGLVTTRREGVRVHYRLAGEDVAALYAQLRQVARAHQPAVEPARAAYLGADTGKGSAGRNCSPARRPARSSSSMCARPRSTPPGTSPEPCPSRSGNSPSG